MAPILKNMRTAASVLSSPVSSTIGSYNVELTKNYREICLLEDV